ncbi:MAG TPA: hypothetical protein VE573_18260 [Nitrososphaeraceae archaeon]|nr:hypothetical protein [Nitrososphaeraceae archaeon]
MSINDLSIQSRHCPPTPYLLQKVIIDQACEEEKEKGYFNRTGSVFLSIVAASFLCGLLHYNRYRDSERLYVLLIVEQTHTYAGAFRINSYTQNR